MNEGVGHSSDAAVPVNVQSVATRQQFVNSILMTDGVVRRKLSGTGATEAS